MKNFNNDRGFGGGRGGFGRRDSGRPAIMHQATCSACGNSCEVPFKPMHGKPVYCNNCFKRSDDAGSGRPERRGGFGKFGRRDFGRQSFGDRGDRQMHEAICSECGEKCEVPFRPTGEKPVYCNDCFGSSKPESFGPKKPDQLLEQLGQLNNKLDKILKVLELIHPKRTFVIEKTEEKNELATEEPKKTAAKSKKTKDGKHKGK